jgi:hypothetical protein
MANTFPVLTWTVSDADLAAGIPTQDDILGSLPASLPEHRWSSTSRNSAHQHVMEELIAGRKDYEPLVYMTKQVTVVRTADLPATIEALHHLLSDIERDPSQFPSHRHWGYSDEQVLACLKEARPDRHIPAEGYFEPQAFFMFLLSQLAILEEARSEGKSVYYIQIR